MHSQIIHVVYVKPFLSNIWVQFSKIRSACILNAVPMIMTNT